MRQQILVFVFIISIDNMKLVSMINSLSCFTISFINLLFIFLLIVVSRFFQNRLSYLFIRRLIAFSRLSDVASLVNWIHIRWQWYCWRVQEGILAHLFPRTLDYWRLHVLLLLWISMMKVIVGYCIICSLRNFRILLINGWPKVLNVLANINFISLDSNKRFSFKSPSLMCSP